METKTVRDFKKLKPGEKDHSLFYGRSLLPEVLDKKTKTVEAASDATKNNTLSQVHLTI